MPAYFEIFFGCFAAATLLPGYSEILVVTQYHMHPNHGTMIWFVASCGNTAGAICNWMLGAYLLQYQDRRWFPASRKQVDRAQQWFQRYGFWSLLFTWLPVIGDPLTILAGTLRIRLLPFIVLVFAGKALRYAVLMAASRGIISIFSN